MKDEEQRRIKYIEFNIYYVELIRKDYIVLLLL